MAKKDGEIVLDKAFWKERVRRLEEEGSPVMNAFKAFKKAKKEKADPFTVKRLKEIASKEARIFNKMMSVDPVFSKILTNDEAMAEFLEKGKKKN